MRVSIREAFNFALKAKGVWKAIITFFLLTLVLEGMNFSVQFASEVPVLGMILICTIFPLILIFSFLLSFYIYAYILEVSDSARRSLFEAPAVFSDIKTKLLRGIYVYVINFVYNIPVIVIIFTMIVAAMVPFLFLDRDFYTDPSGTTLFVIVLLAILALAVSIALIVLTEFLYKGAIYRLVTSNYNLSQAFQLGKVWETFKRGFAENTTLLLKQFAIILAQVTIFIILFTPPVLLIVLSGDFSMTGTVDNFQSPFVVVGTILALVVALFSMFISVVTTYFVLPHMMGQMFRVWDNKGLSKV